MGPSAKTLIFFPSNHLGKMDGIAKRPVRIGRTSTGEESYMNYAKHRNTSARTRLDKPVDRAQHSYAPPCSLTAWKPDGPTVRLRELLKVVRVGRSSAYHLMKNDPTFPKGTPLFDTPRSPRFWWYDQLIIWLRNRELKTNTNNIEDETHD
jgi:hypothetical protein